MIGLLNKAKQFIPEGLKLYIIGWIGFFKNRNFIKSTQKHYRSLEKELVNKKTISIASYVIFDSTFGASELMNLWIRDKRFNPKIVIIPDVSRGQEMMLKQYEKTKSFFISKYGSEFVIDGYNSVTNAFIDPSDGFDLVYLANPYDSMVNKIHGVSYLSKQNVLPFMINYCYLVDYYSYHFVIQSIEQSICWKVFTETYYTQRAYRKYEYIHGKNAVISGYSKMDAMAKCKKTETNRKKIIIAPHHTVNNKFLPLSNFLEYCELIPRLPDLFPGVDFVFRPHPLLFTNLVNGNIWSQKRVDEYLQKLNEKGIEYSYGGDYMSLFLDSDALIHDCGSYIVEYLFTGNPCCFVSKKTNKKVINSFARKCLKIHFRAWSEKDIISFIDDVVSEKRKRTEVPSWFKKKVAVFYPNASLFIYNYLLNFFK